MDFNTGNEDLRSILGNGASYVVPRFQRDYSWEEEHWRDLWEDILVATSDEGEAHYMGYLVLKREGEKEFIVIDGQQRLTTLSLLVLAGLYLLKDDAFPDISAETKQERLEDLQGKYIGTKDSVTLQPANKLQLNRNNDEYYQTITRLETPPVRKIKSSERLLWQATGFFKKKLRETCTSGEDVARLIDRMVGRLFFTRIIVGDELNAYRVFETLNARGVQLSTPDLLKNYLFSKIAATGAHESQLDNLDKQWAAISTQLGNSSFPRFVLAEWNRNHPLVRRSELFRRIRLSIHSPELAMKYLKNLRSRSEVYAALQDPEDEFWHQTPAVKRPLQVLKSFAITQPIGLLMTVQEVLSQEAFERVLRWIEVISIRYNVIGNRSTQFQEGAYNKASRAIFETRSLEKAVPHLRELYPDDDEVIEECARKQFASKRHHKGVRFVLARIEEFVGQNQIAIKDSDLTLEHFLPQNASGGWNTDNVEEDRLEALAHRFGNLALLSSSSHRKLGNNSPEMKRERLDDTFRTNQMLKDEDWDLELIEKRGRWLGRQLTATWRIDFPARPSSN